MKKVLAKTMSQIIEEQTISFSKKIAINGYWHHVRELNHSDRISNGFPNPNYKGTGMALFKVTKMSFNEKVSNK